MKDILMPSFAVALLLLTHIEIGICMRCYQCDNVRNVSDCQHVVSCPTAESCFTDTTGAGDNTIYTLGCRSKQICRQSTPAPQSPLIGRAVTQNLVCSQCCGVDLCNRHVCASGIHGLHTNQCADDPKFNCGQISEIFNVCNDKDHAKLVCRKFCDLCDIIDGYWLEWSSWSTCSQTCGDGVLTRTRMCNRTEGGFLCTGDSSESQHCLNKACPVDGGWTSWSSWSGCSLTCGVGFQRRDRHCSNPYPGPDGLFCDGDSRDDKVCWLTSCTDGIWTVWSDWGSCSAPCQSGISMRSRQCSTSSSASLGHSCVGNDKENKVCNTQLCADGIWAAWSNWGSCSASCQGGISMRSRQCNTTSLGHSCVGNDEEYKVCNTQFCEDGIWTVWSDWGSCSASCQGGISMRSRRCNTTSSASFGHSCVGNDEENKVCNTQLCAGSVVNGGWTMWSSWSTCSAYCMSERTRTCSNPVPSTYGKNCLGNSKEKKDCNQEYCSHPVRLVNGIDPYEGRLEVFHNGQWGTVCDDHFNNSAAAVVCRMLNYDGIPRAYPSATYGQGSLPILLDDVSCTGSEESIFDCKHQSWGSNSCGHSEDVSVSCHTSIHVHLVNGASNNIGRVEVSRGDNVRGTVCDTGFGSNDAKVVCRMLALPTNVTIIYGTGYYGYGSGPSFVTDLSCSSSESNFANCGHFAMKNSSCDHTRSVGVACVNKLYLRLVNGTNQRNGRVEASVDGSNWGPICDSNFNTPVASVICRTLGYQTNISIPYMSTRFGQGAAQHTVSGIGCSGSENSLDDCNFGVVSTTCAHTYNVGVDCSRVNGNVTIPYSSGSFGPGKTQNVLNHTGCSGSENSLAVCNFDAVSTKCSRTFDVCVACTAHINLRLVNGTNPHNGRVEVSLSGGSWGPICDTQFDVHDATVICRMLGYPTHTVIPYGGAYFGHGTQPYLLPGLNCNGNERNIADCTMIGNWQCGENHASGVWCSSNNQDINVRLVNGTNQHNGRVEVSLDGGSNWGPVCDSSFNAPESKVVCRTLGFPTNVTIPYTSARFGPGTTKPVLNHLGCSGSENSLADCTFAAVSPACSRTYDVGVACTAKDINVRLVNGTNQHNGRVEVSLDGGSNWGPVCYSSFNNHFAKVVCRTLDYPTNLTIPYSSARFGPGTTQHVLNYIGCSGSENSLADCNFAAVSQACSRTYDVGVACKTNINLRLVNGTNQHNGRVEVSLDGGNWGPICDSSFDVHDATVICRMLGYPTHTVIPYGGAYFGRGTQPYLLGGLNCNGKERHIADCTMYGNWQCVDNRASGVRCGSNTQDINVRLVDGTNQHNGRVEVSVDGGSNWGPVCDSSFNTLEAKVVCRTLGYPTNVTIPYSSARFGPGTTQTVLNNIGCSGSENSLADCNFAAVAQACSRTYDVGVACKTNINLRLVNGTNNHNGRVEVSLDGGNWGPICDNQFDVHDATVICRMLGYPTHTVIPYGGAYFGQGTQPYLLPGLNCNGNERNIADCTMYGNWQCVENHASGVRCGSNTRNFHARLVNGSNAHSGRLEVSNDGSTWGTVCDSGISQNQANVVCRMLGFPTNFTMVYKEAYFGEGTLHNILSSIHCAGSEQSLNDCTVGLQTSCGQFHEVGIACTAYTGLHWRLVAGSSVHSGRLEVSVDGSNWGTVCDDHFDAAAARVACKMLGFPWSNATTLNPADGRGPILLDDVVCTGSELSIADCGHLALGSHNCGHGEDVGVTCA